MKRGGGGGVGKATKRELFFADSLRKCGVNLLSEIVIYNLSFV